MKARDVALYIYTSGTTGMPKAAKITHMRAQLYMRSFAGATKANAEDKIYCVLPLYHATGGLCGVGSALLNGGTIVLRRRFSASHFWADVIDNNCTMFVYIGELCRYLVNQDPTPKDREHKLRLGFGNGLRPEVWEEFQARFNVPRIMEFYGSTEKLCKHWCRRKNQISNHYSWCYFIIICVTYPSLFKFNSFSEFGRHLINGRL